MVSGQALMIGSRTESLGLLEVQVPQEDLQGSRGQVLEMGSVNIPNMGRSNPGCLVGQRGRRETLARPWTVVS